MKKFNWKQIKDKCKKLSDTINTEKYKNIYGIPKGGIYIASYINEFTGLPITSTPNENTLVVDDLIDSGKTLREFKQDKAVLFRKSHSPQVNYHVEEINDWISFPWEDGQGDIQDSVIRQLEYIKEDPNRQGLKDTPKRVIKSFKTLYGGYDKEIKEVINGAMFDSEGYEGIVLCKNIELYSTCEHHLLPFTGKCHIGYIPNKKVIGVSKLVRVMELFARRLQIQERLVLQIANALEKYLEPKGVIVYIEAQHWCMRSRGVGKQNSIMVTSETRGLFRDKPELESKFLQMIN